MTQKIKVTSLTSPRTGAPVANQFVIETKEGTYFQSYNSIIAFKDNAGRITLDQTYYNYSRTTIKYRNIFTGFDTPTTHKKINAGEITLADLN